MIVDLPNGEKAVVNQLFGSNTKLKKRSVGQKGYMLVGLSLAPHTISGYNCCPSSTPGCRKSCIYVSGYSYIYPNILKARIAKTIAWFEHRDKFKDKLEEELFILANKAKQLNMQLSVRLNVFSDIPWEQHFPEIFKKYPEVMFYDYTKIFKRMMKFTEGKLPKNYHLTFSRSEQNEKECQKVLDAGGNVSVVFKITPHNWKLSRPQEWNGYPVIDGEKSDLRFLDPKNSVIGLVAKGLGRKDKTRFALPMVQT